MTNTHTSRLMRAFNTSAADLEANREGTLTRAQHGYLKPAQSQTIVQVVLWGHLLLISGLILLITLISREPILLLVCGGVMGLSIMPFTMLRTTAVDLRMDLADGMLETVSGKVEVTRKGNKDNAYRVKLIDQKVSFGVTRKQASAFRSDVPYTIYYLPKSRVIVSAEVPYNDDDSQSSR